jgi:hypothetical protein
VDAAFGAIKPERLPRPRGIEYASELDPVDCAEGFPELNPSVSVEPS